MESCFFASLIRTWSHFWIQVETIAKAIPILDNISLVLGLSRSCKDPCKKMKFQNSVFNINHLLSSSILIGNVFVFVAFQDKETIDKQTRDIVVWTLSVIGFLGLIIICFLPRPPKILRKGEDRAEEKAEGPVEALVKAGKLFITKNMLLLSFIFLYTGKSGFVVLCFCPVFISIQLFLIEGDAFVQTMSYTVGWGFRFRTTD